MSRETAMKEEAAATAKTARPGATGGTLADSFNPAYHWFMPAADNRLTTFILRVEEILGAAPVSHPLYPWPSVLRRTAQEFGLLILRPFLRANAARTIAGNPLLDVHRDEFVCGGFRFSPAEGIRPQRRLVAASLVRFALHWMACAAALLLTRRMPRPDAGRSTLVFGVPPAAIAAGPKSAEFAEFCRAGPVAPLRSNGPILVQTVVPSPAAGNIRYVRHPVLELVQAHGASLAERLAFLREHARTAASFVRTVARAPLTCILWRDFAYHALAWSLDRRHLIEAIVLTNSTWWRQFLWTTDLAGKKFRTHMIFDSTNDKPYAYRDAIEQCRVDPGLRLLRADAFWVWAREQGETLASEGVKGDVHVCGPVLWHLFRPPLPADDTEVHVAVFDITPVTQEANRNLGLLGNYISTPNLVAFIEGIETALRAVSARLGRSVVAVVKQKRAPAAIHDPLYIEWLHAACRAESALLRLAPPETSAYDLATRCVAAIVYPYTSAAYVAAHAGVAAIYFDPAGVLLQSFDASERVSMVSSVDALTEQLAAAVLKRDLPLERAEPKA